MLAFDLFQKPKSRKKKKQKVTHTKPNKTEMNPIKNKSVLFQSKPNLFKPLQTIPYIFKSYQIKPNQTYPNQTDTH